MRGRCEGRLVATLPLSYQGVLINSFSVDFKDGKAVAVHADEQIVYNDSTVLEFMAGVLGAQTFPGKSEYVEAQNKCKDK